MGRMERNKENSRWADISNKLERIKVGTNGNKNENGYYQMERIIFGTDMKREEKSRLGPHRSREL